MLSIRRRPSAPEPTLERRGYRRSPVTLSSYRQGKEPANKGRRFPAEPLTATEVYKLIAACDGRAATRNRALITILWRTGLRNAEALALYPKDVDLERGRIAVLHGKGDRQRVVPIDYAAAKIVDRWRREREQLGFDALEAFFCVIEGPTRGFALNDAYPRNLLKELAPKAGITKRVHPHGLRHSYAAYLLDEGVPIHFIRRALGHASIAITEAYADKINPAIVVETLRGLEWPAAPMDIAASTGKVCALAKTRL